MVLAVNLCRRRLVLFFSVVSVQLGNINPELTVPASASRWCSGNTGETSISSRAEINANFWDILYIYYH